MTFESSDSLSLNKNRILFDRRFSSTSYPSYRYPQTKTFLHIIYYKNDLSNFIINSENSLVTK